MRAVSKKRQADAPRRRMIREAVFARDGGCVLRHYANHQCIGDLTPHHLQKASQGGPYEEWNIITLCSTGNSWVEDEPQLAHALGLVIRAGDTVAEAYARRFAWAGCPEELF